MSPGRAEHAPAGSARHEVKPRSRWWRYRAFGLALRSSFPLPAMRPLGPGRSRLSVTLGSPAAVKGRFSGTTEPPVWIATIDGRGYRMELGFAGDHLMTFGDEAVFHLSAGLGELRCAPVDRREPAWQRFLLDTVLWSTSLLAGAELCHASAVQGRRGVVAFPAFSGAGKTALAAELVVRGAPLFCDDILALRQSDGRVRAYPGPPVMNLPDSGPYRLVLTNLGDPLASFEDEKWVAVRNTASGSCNVAAVCLLRRRPKADLELRRLPATVLDLLPFSLGFRHLPDRARARFVLFARLAAETPVYELAAAPEVPPSELADRVEPLLSSPDPATSAI
jgi:hypothetical protein